MSTNNPKAQFQIDNGNGWQTIAEADIINGVVNPPNAWTMVRALQKRIMYTGSLPVEVTVVPDNPRDTHFSGYAEALLDELVHTYFEDAPMMDRFWEETKKKIELLLTQRAYDLVLHTVWRTIPASGSTILKYQGKTIEEIAAMIPDLPKLPEVQE